MKLSLNSIDRVNVFNNIDIEKSEMVAGYITVHIKGDKHRTYNLKNDEIPKTVVKWLNQKEVKPIFKGESKITKTLTQCMWTYKKER